MSNNVAFFNYGDPASPQVQKFLNDEESKYRVFTGADLTAYIGNIRVGKLQGITCSVTRETMPIYTTGDPNCKAFAKGKRGIAGSLVFTQFDKHAILRDLINTKAQRLQDLWAALHTNSQGAGSLPSQFAVNIPANVTPTNYSDLLATSAINGASVSQREVLETAYLVSQRAVNYVDQIPPFDITVTFVNEAGNAAFFAVHGCQLVNEGFGFSLDDLHSETAYTFLARAVTPMEALGDPTNLTAAGLSGIIPTF
jgi:hypothetical protein